MDSRKRNGPSLDTTVLEIPCAWSGFSIHTKGPVVSAAGHNKGQTLCLMPKARKRRRFVPHEFFPPLACVRARHRQLGRARRRGGSVRTPNGFSSSPARQSRRASRPVLSSLCKSKVALQLRYRFAIRAAPAMMIYSTLRCDNNNGVDGYIYGAIGWEGIDVVVIFGVSHDDGAGLDGLV
jgi:hypothetical protein